MRVLLGLVRRDSGAISVLGADPAFGPAALRGVGGFVEEPAFYPYLTGRRNLRLLSALDRGRPDTPRVEWVLEELGLADRGNDRVATYSQGMRQRLGIAAALLRDPRLLLLDEPANGLDPAGIRDMRRLVRKLADQGVTILYSSHLLAEVEELCTRLAILDRGRVIFEGALHELRRSAGEEYRIETSEPARTLALALASGVVQHASMDGSDVILTISDPDGLDGLTAELGRAGIGIRALVPQRASLEELFLRLTEGSRGERAA
jgi:ABC-2 type transport system ATP-binding protein